eukprot:gene32101-41624_t
MGSRISTLVFQPPEVSYVQAKKHILWLPIVNDKREMTASGEKITIPAFYIDRKSKITILFSHGNAEDIGMIFDSFNEFSKELWVNVLAYDYEGYGKAGGESSEANCYDDIDAAYNFLTEKMQMKPENIVLYGRSLGSGPSCYLAERLQKENIQIGGIILQSPLLSVYRVAFNFRFTLPGDMFPNVDRIRQVRCPVFVIHGTRDEIVPFRNGEVDGEEFYEQIKEFLVQWVPAYRSALSFNSMTFVANNNNNTGGRFNRI